MKIIVLKDKPLEYQSFPLYAQDGISPLGEFVELEEELLRSNVPLKFDGKNVMVDTEAQLESLLLKQKEVIIQKIAESKSYLTATDYLLFKVMDGVISSEEYEPIRLRRIEERRKINDLEKELI